MFDASQCGLVEPMCWKSNRRPRNGDGDEWKIWTRAETRTATFSPRIPSKPCYPECLGNRSRMPPMPAKTPNALLHGALDALILKTLTRGPCHGYAIARSIEDTTGDAVLVEDGSLYPALYRLERRGWVDAEWGTSELGRRAKLYRLTDAGRAPARRRAGDLAAVLRRRVEGAAAP